MSLYCTTLVTLPLAEATIVYTGINGAHRVGPSGVEHMVPSSLLAVTAQVQLTARAVPADLGEEEGGEVTVLPLPGAYLARHSAKHALTSVTAPLPVRLCIADRWFGRPEVVVMERVQGPGVTFLTEVKLALIAVIGGSLAF